MKLDSQKLRSGFARYTQADIDFIISNYRLLSPKEIADALGRTEAAINQKIFVLKLAQVRRKNIAKAVAKFYPVISTKKSSVVIDITNVKLSDGLELFKALGKFQYKIV